MMRTWHILLPLFAVALAGCGLEKDNETDGSELAEKETLILPNLYSTWEDSDETRTVLHEDGMHVLWEPSDVLRVYFGHQMADYITDIVKPSLSAVFKPDYTTVRQSGISSQSSLYAFSPASAASIQSQSPYKEGMVEFSHLSVQQGVEESFLSRYMPAMARSTTNEPNGALVFYYVCGGIRFSVAQEGITSVVFKSRNGSPLSGRVRAQIGEDRYPSVASVVSGVDSVKVSAPGEAFIPGRHYFAVMLPQSLENGLSVKFYKKRLSASTIIDKPLIIRRARFGILDGLDKGLAFETMTPSSVPNGIIDFKSTDGRLKYALLQLYDSDGDGEISYAEAASVTSFDDLVSNFSIYFWNCSSFDEMQYFTSITKIPGNWFINNKYYLSSVCFPPGLKVIGEFAFKGSNSLRTFHKLPSSLESIEHGAFYECTQLEDFVLPSSLRSIGNVAFRGCQALTRIDIPDSVIEIGENAFQGCNNLQTIRIGQALEAQKGFVFDKRTGDGYLKSRFLYTPVKHIYVSDGINRIPEHTFENLHTPETIRLPASISDIPAHSFEGFIYLSQIDHPWDFVSIGAYSFSRCISLRSAPCTTDLTFLGEHAFEGSGLESVIIPQSLTEIPPYCFANCGSLSSVSIPESITSIGKYAFSQCGSLSSISIPESVVTIRENAFAHSGLESVIVPQCWTAIPDSCFLHCINLSSIRIPESVVSIGKDAFKMCYKLSTVIFPASLATWGEGSFSKCSILTTVVFNSTTPPVYEGDPKEYVFERVALRIYVPDESIEVYKTDPFFLKYASKIYPISEYKDN